MQIEIDDILKSLGAHKELSFEEDMQFDYIDFADSVSGNIKITNVGGRIFAEGKIKTKVKLNCCKCCEDFIFPIEVNLREEFLDRKSEQVRSLEEADLEELQGFIYDNNVIDLREALRQNIITAISVNPVCSENCKGICTVCGKNRNKEKCSCRPA